MKKFKFEIKEMLEDGSFTGIASMYGNVDLGGDIVEKGAFTKTLQEKNSVPILWQHKTDMPIGIGMLEDTENGLMISGKLNLEVEKAKEAYALIKQGAVKGLSIGYDVIKQKYDKGVRLLKELRLWEVSIVTFPMNMESVISGVKELDEEKGLDANGEEIVKKPRKKSADMIQQMIEMLNTMLQEEGMDETDMVKESVKDNLETKEETPELIQEVKNISDLFKEMEKYLINREEI